MTNDRVGFLQICHARRPCDRRRALQAGLLGLAATALDARPSAAQATTQMATPEASSEAPFPPDEQLALEAIVRQGLAETDTPGALVGVWHPGRGRWVRAAGSGDLSTAAPMTEVDHVRIASITKTFAATVVLQLVDDGKLSLDDHLEQIVPGIPNGDQITLRQVLGTTAGIHNFVNDPVIAVDYNRDPLLPFSPEQAIDIVKRHAPDFPPGAKTQYSDSNHVLLGFVIERATVRSAAKEITDRIVKPLGLTGTRFPESPDIPKPYAHGYAAAAVGDRLGDVTRSNQAVPWTAGAMISTLADLRVWAKALADGLLLGPATQRQRLTWNRIPNPYFDLGYGLGVMEVNGLIGHNVGILGYSSWMLHAPDEDATLVVVTNRAATEGGTADPIFYDIVQFLLPDRFPPLTTTPANATPSA